MKIWIVVANEREALFYDAGGATDRRCADGPRSADRFPLMLRIANPQVRSDRRLETRRLGGSSTGETRGVDGERRFRHSDEEYFASRIAEEIERARQVGKFDRLVLGGAPEILRPIRAALSAPCRALLAAEVAKDVVWGDERALLAQWVLKPVRARAELRA